MASRIGSYEIVRELGSGAAGRVFRTRDPSGEDVVLKLLVDSAAAGPNSRRRFEREAEALARLDHPNVVRVREVGEHEACPFLVMDLVEGESLQQRLDRVGPLAPAMAATIAQRLAVALEYCHACGVLHRDLKPDNVLIGSDGAPRLIDFGLSKDLSASYSRLSHTGAFMGTPGYWAPEMAVGEVSRVDPTTDVYGLGATLYAMLTGRPPFEGDSLPALLVATEQQAPVPPSQRRGDVDPELEAICLRCLEKEQAKRYPSAAALARELARYLEGGPSPTRRAPPRPARSALPLAAGIIVLGAGLAALVIVSRPRASQSGASPSESPAPSQPQVTRPPSVEEAAEALLARARGAATPELALRLASEAVELAPEYAPVWHYRGKVHATLQRWDECMADLDRALVLDATNYETWADRGLARSEQGDLHGSIDDFSRAVELEPGFAVGFHDRGIAKEALGDMRGAVEDFGRALEADPTLARAYTARGGAYLNAGEAERALADSERALELDSNDATAHMNRGAALGRLRRPADGLPSLDRALELEPARAAFWINRSALKADLGQVDAALLDLSEALRLEPANPIALLNRGIIRMEDLDDPAGAIPDFRAARDGLPPRHPFHARALGLLEEAQRRAGR